MNTYILYRADALADNTLPADAVPIGLLIGVIFYSVLQWGVRRTP